MTTSEAKVVLLGPAGAGKTSLIQRYIGNIFSKSTVPTIGASFFSCEIAIEDHTIRLLLWDTAGQERFRSMAPMYYRNSHAAIVMFDITSWRSFEEMQAWIQELKVNVIEPVILCVVGNKLDMNRARDVPFADAVTFARSIGALYHETSALNSEGVETVFVDIAQELLRKNLNSMAVKNQSAEIKHFQEGKVIRVKEDNQNTNNPNGEERSLFCC